MRNGEHVQIRPMHSADYAAAYNLWENTEGIGLSDADSQDCIERFLRLNPGLSLVACVRGVIIGTLLVSSDGRRGFLNHLAVSAQFRRNGIGRKMIEKAIESLFSLGICRYYVFVFDSNPSGAKFWSSCNFSNVGGLSVMRRY